MCKVPSNEQELQLVLLGQLTRMGSNLVHALNKPNSHKTQILSIVSVIHLFNDHNDQHRDINEIMASKKSCQQIYDMVA